MVVIELPPLRERPEDVKCLVDYFNHRLSEEYGVAPKEISDDAMRLLQTYGWPGNVRELENAVERAFALGHGPVITPADLPADMSGPSSAAAASGKQMETGGVVALAESEKMTIVRALEACGGNKVKVANALGIPRKRLYRLLHTHGLMPKK